jgi:hypothetical protein
VGGCRRQAFVENLLRASLGQPEAIRWPAVLTARLRDAIARLRVVETTGATVQDAAEVATALYDLAVAIPNLPPWVVPGEWVELDEGATPEDFELPELPPPTDGAWPEGEPVEYRSPETPQYRGGFKPELVQLIDELTDRQGASEEGTALTREEILELLERSAEIEHAEEPGDRPSDLEAILANLEQQAAERGADAGESNGEVIEWFRYDEWDFRAHDYRPEWCRVGERIAAEGEIDFSDETLRRYHGLVVETRRQFERMRPESFRRLKRLEDGHEIDLDQAIEFHADKKAGAGPLARFYERRNKVRRDVAVAFLLDMSGSTSEEVLPSLGAAIRSEGPGGGRAALKTAGGGPRIIDIEREATVVVVEALEAIGDAYAIYGFSGHGRENVEFHVIKNFDEPFGDPVRRRIGRIEPIRSARRSRPPHREAERPTPGEDSDPGL